MLMGFTQRAANWEFVGEVGASNNIVIPNQRAGFSGNLHRIPGSLSSYKRSYSAVFRNLSTRNGASIQEIATEVLSYFIAMTGNSINSNFPLYCVKPTRLFNFNGW